MKWRATASFVGHRHRLVVGRRVVRRVVDSRQEGRQDRLTLLGGERLREAVRDPKLAARLAVASSYRAPLERVWGALRCHLQAARFSMY